MTPPTADPIDVIPPPTPLTRWQGSGRRGRFSSRLDRLSDGQFAAVVAAPGLILVAFFLVPPILAAIGLSFFRIELGRDGFTPYVALRNFVVRLPADAEFLATLPRTVGFAMVATAISVPVALAAASLINGARRWRGALSLLLILPWAVAPIADGLIWRLLLEPSEGIIGKLLLYAHLPPVKIGQPVGALIAMLLAVVWRAIPLLGVLFLGALRQVPRDLPRAARLDGASRWQAFRFITLPAIAPTLIAATFLQIILTLQVFDIQFAMSADQPPPDAVLTGLAVYHTVINDIALGYGAAETMVLALLIGVCLLGIWLLVIRPRDRAALTQPPVDGDAGEPGTGHLRIPASARPRSDAISAPLPPAVPDPRRRRAAVRRAAVRVLEGIGIAALIVFLAAPLVWILIVSVQSDVFLRQDPPHLGPPFIFNTFTELLQDRAWQAAALVSIVVTTAATVLSLAVAAFAAYPLARYRFRGDRWLLLALIATQLIPPIALAIPVLFIFVRLELRNTVPGMILINAAFWAPILVWLLRGAFMSVPRNLDLAARIDGSSRLGAILRVIVPAAGPAIAAATAIVFVGIWNDFVFAAVLGGRDTYTLPRYLGESSTPTFHSLAVRIVVTIAPCIVILAVLRRRIVGLL